MSIKFLHSRGQQKAKDTENTPMWREYIIY